MGEMADLAADEYYASLAEEEFGYLRSASRPKPQPMYKTEDVLNRNNWVDGQGVVHELETMERDHLQNVLYFLYKKRDRYWLNCRDVSMVDKFKDGDQFFQMVIRKSVIWNAILETLETPEQGFAFQFDLPKEENK